MVRRSVYYSFIATLMACSTLHAARAALAEPELDSLLALFDLDAQIDTFSRGQYAAMAERCTAIPEQKTVRCTISYVSTMRCAFQVDYSLLPSSPRVRISTITVQQRDFDSDYDVDFRDGRLNATQVDPEAAADLTRKLVAWRGLPRFGDDTLPVQNRIAARKGATFAAGVTILPVTPDRAYLLEEVWDREAARTVYTLTIGLLFDRQFVIGDTAHCHTHWSSYDYDRYDRWREGLTLEFELYAYD